MSSFASFWSVLHQNDLLKCNYDLSLPSIPVKTFFHLLNCSENKGHNVNTTKGAEGGGKVRKWKSNHLMVLLSLSPSVDSFVPPLLFPITSAQQGSPQSRDSYVIVVFKKSSKYSTMAVTF